MACPSWAYVVYSYPILSLIALWIIVHGIVRLIRGHPPIED